jgi:DNA-binding CsgD family transcriptional regulator
MTVNTIIKNDILSPREKEVAIYMLEGHTTNLIAKKIGIKSNTVSTIKKSLFFKLKVTSVLDLYKFTSK